MEFDDTRRFSPSKPLPSASSGIPDNTNPLYAAPSVAYASPQGSASLAVLIKLLFRKHLSWAIIAVLMMTFIGLGIGIGRGTSRRRAPDYGGADARQEVDASRVRHEYEETVQNALGFKQGVYSSQEFSDARGIFVNNLMSDDSAAALAKIQAGDLITKLNDKPVPNDNELSQILEQLKTRR